MTPNDKLPEEIRNRIKIEANEIYWQTHKISKGRDPYCMGLTMFEVAQVPLIEALTAKQLKYDELQAQAQCMAEDIQLMLDQFALNPELSWFDIAHKMKGIGLDALRQFKDGKGKEVENIQASALLNLPDDNSPTGMPLPTEDPFKK